MRNERMSRISIDGLYILQLIAEGGTDVTEILCRSVKNAANHRLMSAWCDKAGISTTTAGCFASDKTAGLNMYTAEQLLKAQGLRLTIEVDE